MVNNSWCLVKTVLQIMVVLSLVCAALFQELLYDTSDEDDYEDSFYVDTANGKFETEDYESRPVEERALESDVSYHFFSQHNQSGVFLKYSTVAILNETDFTAEKTTLFVIHGWKGHLESNFNNHVKNALLRKHVNLFMIDWSPVAKKNYITARMAVVEVGKYVAGFVKTLVSEYGLQLSKVAFIGHSLGAHISGNAGMVLEGKVQYIVGLDPASPLFTRLDLTNRLDSSDAKFVQGIHTCGGRLGVMHAIGHSDYYPNGGRKQPGCGFDLIGRCAHARAWYYYVESVSANTNLFVARRCASYNSYTKGKCTHNVVSLMAGYPIDTNASGNYYLTTNESPPFGKG